MKYQPHILILGGRGFIGSHVTAALLNEGIPTRVLDVRGSVEDGSYMGQYKGLLQVQEGSVFDAGSLKAALQGIETLVDAVSFSIPSYSPLVMECELATSIPAINAVLKGMKDEGCRSIVYFSSGGTVYGDTGARPAREDDSVAPTCSYGLGKVFCEEMIRFATRVWGLDCLILRVSNVYGRRQPGRYMQGVVDVFVDQVSRGLPLTVWGSGQNVRDYIFIDDLARVVVELTKMMPLDAKVLNVGSGECVSTLNIISIIAQVIGFEPEWIFKHDRFAGVASSRLDLSLLHSLVDWRARYSLVEGITEMWRRRSTSPSRTGVE